MPQNLISYNESGANFKGSKNDIEHGYNLWIDLIDPDPSELLYIRQSFQLDLKAFMEYSNHSKSLRLAFWITTSLL